MSQNVSDIGPLIEQILVNESFSLDTSEIAALVAALDKLYYFYNVSIVSDIAYDHLESLLPKDHPVRNNVGWSTEYQRFLFPWNNEKIVLGGE